MIPFNKPYLTGRELEYIADAHSRGQLAGDGFYTRKCSSWIEEHTGCFKALLTHSCTAGLEMAAILANIQPGDEVIMPSYTFVSTANAFVLRGGIPVFVDIRNDTLNIDESLIEEAITPRTKAVVVVHYGGVACEMDAIMTLSRRHGLLVIEDAAQGIMARYQGRALGAIGDIGCYSFHETKNVISGEGGALLINNPELAERAEVIREKGTNRRQFLNGYADKYTWMDVGSSFLPGEIVSAFLYAQLQESAQITSKRLSLWENYYSGLYKFEMSGRIRRRTLPEGCTHNGHIYEIILNSLEERKAFISSMNSAGIHCVFHYVPLHTSPMGQIVGRSHGDLHLTKSISQALVRLPLWIGIEEFQHQVIREVANWLESY